jgi:predicted small secreted protein
MRRRRTGAVLAAVTLMAVTLAGCGSPGPATVRGTGRIVGVIGGYQQGGNTAGISYSAYLGNAIKQLYRQASA